MSKTFGFFKDMVPRGNVTTSNYPMPVYSNINVQLSNVAYIDLADTLTLTMNTNLTNGQRFFMTINGVQGNVFTDGSNVANATVDAFGNLTINKSIANHSNNNISNTSFTVTLKTTDPTVGETVFTSNALYVRTVGTTSLQTSGGTTTVYEQSGYHFAIAKSNSNIRALNPSVTNVPMRYLIVGGGGAAGAGSGGTYPLSVYLNGGGAGGNVISGTSNVTVNTYYPATVGAGGDGLFAYSFQYTSAANGGSSSFLSNTAIGGGGGGWGNVIITPLAQAGFYTNSGKQPIGNLTNGLNGSAKPGILGGSADGIITSTSPYHSFAAGGGGAGAGGAGQTANRNTYNPIRLHTGVAGAGGAGILDNILLTDYYWGAGGAGRGLRSTSGDIITAIPPTPNTGQAGSNGNAATNVGRGAGEYNVEDIARDGYPGVVIARVPKYVIKLSES